MSGLLTSIVHVVVVGGGGIVIVMVSLFAQDEVVQVVPKKVPHPTSSSTSHKKLHKELQLSNKLYMINKNFILAVDGLVAFISYCVCLEVVLNSLESLSCRKLWTGDALTLMADLEQSLASPERRIILVTRNCQAD